eukprot:7382039-Pyramimonas_sp.AAC.1
MRGGFNFFALFESRCRQPNRFLDYVDPAEFFSDFEQRHLPLTTMGYGAASLLHKSLACQHCLALETGSKGKFDIARNQVRVFTSDQGLEFGIADTPLLLGSDLANVAEVLHELDASPHELNTVLASQSFFLPNAITVPDALHVVYNALKDTITSRYSWKGFESHLRAFAKFLGNRDLRGRFKMRCCKTPGDKSEISRFSVRGSFDWKWEYLERFTSQLSSVLPTMFACWDPVEFKRGCGREEIEAGQGPPSRRRRRCLSTSSSWSSSSLSLEIVGIAAVVVVDVVFA